MKKFILMGIVSAIFIMQQGCIPLSTYPAYTNKDVVYDPNLLGKWSGSAGISGGIAAEFTPGDLPKLYMLKLKWQGKQGTARAVLFKIDNHTFMDIAPKDSNDVFADLIFIPAHLIVRIDKTSPQIEFAPISETKLAELLATNPRDVECHSFDQKTLFTCSTLRMRSFLAQHANKIFDSVITLKPFKQNASPVWVK